jgi:hypothetical protein
MTGGAIIQPFSPIEPGFDSDPMVQVARLFVYFLQNLFRKFPDGCGLTWRPDEKTTELVITHEKPKLEAIEKMPHIVCVTGSGQWSNLGLDQMQTTKMLTGQRTHTDLLPMTMAYHCQAREGLHARRMAWNASLYTNVLRRLLMGTNKLHHVAPSSSISAESGPTAYVGPTSEEEIVSVVVTVPFYLQPAWTIKDPSHVLRKFDMAFRVRDTTLRPPRIKGRPAKTLTQEDHDTTPPAVVQQTVISDPED